MIPTVRVDHEHEWRSKQWDTDVPSRPAWFVSCVEHPELGKDWNNEPWGYASRGIAQGVATRHRRAKHGGGHE